MVNAVITSLPSYNMQIQWFCNMFVIRWIEQRGTLFGEDQMITHMVSWKKTQPKEMGGLGIRTTHFSKCGTSW